MMFNTFRLMTLNQCEDGGRKSLLFFIIDVSSIVPVSGIRITTTRETTMIDKAILNSHFYGTETWERWSPLLYPDMLMTDGVQYVSNNGGDQGAYRLVHIGKRKVVRMKKTEGARTRQSYCKHLRPFAKRQVNGQVRRKAKAECEAQK
jgi:hypothetical protein